MEALARGQSSQGYSFQGQPFRYHRPADYVVDPAGDTIINLYNYNVPFAVPEPPVLPPNFRGPGTLGLSGTREGQIPGPSAPFRSLITAPVTPPPQTPIPMRFQVSSLALVRASPQFSHILHDAKVRAGHFHPGYNPNDRNRTMAEVGTRGFDVAAFLTFQRIIHGESGPIPADSGIEIVAKLAVIAHHYGCRERVSAWANPRITYLAHGDKHYSREIILFIWVSYFFQRPRIFSRMTRIAIMEAPTAIFALSLPIPSEIMIAINETRYAAIRGMIETVHRARQDIMNQSEKPKCTFQCRAFVLGCLEIQMAQAGLLTRSEMAVPPFHGIVYFELRRTIRSWKCIGVDKLSHNCGPHVQEQERGVRSLLSSSALREFFGDMNWAVEGLVLTEFIGSIPPRVGVSLIEKP